MARTKLVKSAGRFGVRYGQSLRRRTVAVESRQRKKQACPFCAGRAVRQSKGIWNCRRCNKTFAGHTYYLDAEYHGSKLNEKFAQTASSKESPESNENKSLKKQKTSSNKDKSKKTKSE